MAAIRDAAGGVYRYFFILLHQVEVVGDIAPMIRVWPPCLVRARCNDVLSPLSMAPVAAAAAAADLLRSTYLAPHGGRRVGMARMQRSRYILLVVYPGNQLQPVS